MAVPLRTRPDRLRGAHRGRSRWCCTGLIPRCVAMAGIATVASHRGSRRPCARLAAQGVVDRGPACRAHLRRCRDHGGRRMAHRGYRTRPGHATDARPRGRSHAAMCAPLVGQPPAPRQGPRRAQARIVAGDRPRRRPGRIAGHVRHGGRLGLAGPLPPGARPDHPRRDREDTGHRVGSRHLPGRRPRLPDARRPGQPLRAARARHRPARRRHHLAWPVRHVDHRAHRPRPVRGRRSVPRAVPAPARPVRRGDRRGQERLAQRAHGQPGRPAATWSSGPST